MTNKRKIDEDYKVEWLNRLDKAIRIVELYYKEGKIIFSKNDELK